MQIPFTTGNEQLIGAKGRMPQIPVITAQTQTIKKKPKLISVGCDMSIQLFSVSHSIWISSGDVTHENIYFALVAKLNKKAGRCDIQNITESKRMRWRWWNADYHWAPKLFFPLAWQKVFLWNENTQKDDFKGNWGRRKQTSLFGWWRCRWNRWRRSKDRLSVRVRGNDLLCSFSSRCNEIDWIDWLG